MSYKKIAALILGLAVTSTSFTACTSKVDEVGQKTSGGGGEVQYPIKSDATLTYWGVINVNVASTKGSLNETEFAKQLEKQTGIKIKYIHPAQGQEKEQFNLLLASGDLPDMIEYTWSTFPGGPEKAINDGTILKLNDVIDKYSPNLKKYLNSNNAVNKDSKTDEGNYFQYPFIRGDELLTVYYGPIMRADWLKELGLQPPTTISEWENVLRAFKDKKGAAAPLTFNLQEIFGAFAGAYGVNYGINNGFYLDNNTVKFGPAEQGFKDFVTTFSRWYKEGLLDKNFATVDKKILASDMLSGKSGATLGYAGSSIGTWIPQMKEKDPKFELVGLQYPSLKKGETPKFGQKQFLNTGQGVAISSKSKNVELAARFLDYGYSKEGMDLYNFGIKDVSYTEVNGVPKYTSLITKNPEGLSQAQAMSIYMRTYSGPFIQRKEYIDEYYQLSEQKDAVKAWNMTDSSKTLLPNITPLQAESSEASKIDNEISTYVNEMFLKFVMGIEPLDNYDKYLNQINKLGLDKSLQIKQSALERYNKR